MNKRGSGRNQYSYYASDDFRPNFIVMVPGGGAGEPKT